MLMPPDLRPHNRALFAHARLAPRAGHSFARDISALRFGPPGLTERFTVLLTPEILFI
jgi:hypothetical protein